VQSRDRAGEKRAHEGQVSWAKALGFAGLAALVASATYDGAVALTRTTATADPLADYGFFEVVGRLFSLRVLSGWSAPGLVLLVASIALGALLVRRHARARAGAWKLAGAFAAGWSVYWAASLVEGLARHAYSVLPVHLGALAGVVALAVAARAGDRRDAVVSAAVGRSATHPVWGLPILAFVLLLAYKVVGVFGAGTAVDFVENRLFGAPVAQVNLDAPQPPEALATNDGAEEGSERLVAVSDGGSVRIVAQTKRGGVYVEDPAARIDVYGGTEARVWTGYLNRWAYGFFAWLGIPLLTAFFVGPYGLLTMGVTYAVAIVLPVVATFFFVF